MVGVMFKDVLGSNNVPFHSDFNFYIILRVILVFLWPQFAILVGGIRFKNVFGDYSYNETTFIFHNPFNSDF